VQCIAVGQSRVQWDSEAVFLSISVVSNTHSEGINTKALDAHMVKALSRADWPPPVHLTKGGYRPN
jgi:hypothetical protein